jgi:hypothetical protein
MTCLPELKVLIRLLGGHQECSCRPVPTGISEALPTSPWPERMISAEVRSPPCATLCFMACEVSMMVTGPGNHGAMFGEGVRLGGTWRQTSPVVVSAVNASTGSFRFTTSTTSRPHSPGRQLGNGAGVFVAASSLWLQEDDVAFTLVSTQGTGSTPMVALVWPLPLSPHPFGVVASSGSAAGGLLGLVAAEWSGDFQRHLPRATWVHGFQVVRGCAGSILGVGPVEPGRTGRHKHLWLGGCRCHFHALAAAASNARREYPTFGC